MKRLVSRCRFALLVPIAMLGCGSSDTPPTPDYDSLRKEDDTKHSAYPPPPAATTNTGWPNLSPAPGKTVNVGVQGGTEPDAGADAGIDTGVDTGVRETGVLSPEYYIATYLYVSGSRRLASSVSFTDDPSVTITRTGTTLFTIRSSYSYLYFTWSAANANLAGYGLQFGTEPYIYVQSASSSTTGSSSMSMYISSTVCQYLPNTCYLTTMKLQAMSQAVDGGLSAGISAPASIQVAIDCGGCL